MSKPYRIIVADVLDGLGQLPDASVQCVVTSPPYWGLRDYGTAEWEGGDVTCDHRAPSRFDYPLNPGLGPTGIQRQDSNRGSGSLQQYAVTCLKCGAHRTDKQIGLEATPDEYVAKLVAVFREVRRVLRDDGTVWLNMGDSYTSGNRPDRDPAMVSRTSGKTNRSAGGARARTPLGLKPKDLVGIPWRVALALQADGWWLRSDIIWAKPNPMPESCTDRPTNAHEYVFLLTKNARYYYDAEAVKEPAINAGRIVSYDGTQKNTGHENPTYPGTKPRDILVAEGRNLRNVWTIPTQPFTGWTRTCHLDRVELDAASDDTMRITSRDCPVHEGQADRVPNAFRDERVADQLSHILDKRARLDQEQADEPAPSPMIRKSRPSVDGSDSPHLDNSSTATRHNTGIHKTASLSASGDTASEGTPVRIGHTLPLHETPGSDGSDDLGSSETPDHTSRRCTCEHYSMSTKEISHFATFPEALPERCIRAGSKENDTILDPFSGSGTTGVAACLLGRQYVGIELNPQYAEMSERRIGKALRPSTYADPRPQQAPLFEQAATFPSSKPSP